jgi:hypothetical protein
MPKIFISYRRQDSNHQAGRLYDHLSAHFGPDQLFKDVDSIELGQDFRKVLAEKVGECDVLLALVGDGWLSAASPAGQRRLDDPTDYVRIEIESALRRGIPVIPLLVGQAPVPAPESLPPSLQDLAYRHGTHIRPDPDFREDVQRLVRHLSKMTGTSAREPEPPVAPPPDPPPVRRPERHEDLGAGRPRIRRDWMWILRLLIIPGVIANILLMFQVNRGQDSSYGLTLMFFTAPAAALLWGDLICGHVVSDKVNNFNHYAIIFTIICILVETIIIISIYIKDIYVLHIEHSMSVVIFGSLALGLMIGIPVGLVGARATYVLRKLISPKAPAAEVRET